MANWSGAIKLDQYDLWKEQTNAPGVYEIGFVRGKLSNSNDVYNFNAKYLGKASISIYDRLKKHWNEIGSKSIAEYYSGRKRDLLYFHYIRTLNYDAMEANLLNRHGIGKDGLYEFNRRLESI